MTTNPLKSNAPSSRKVTTAMLHDLAASLNKERFVKGMGRFYRVGRESDGQGGFRHFLTWDTARAS